MSDLEGPGVGGSGYSARLIGITGRARSGKDTVADILVRDHGFAKIAFADHLKRCCRDIFGFTDEQLWGGERDVVDERMVFAPRYALQRLGTEFGRSLYPNVWIDPVMRTIESLRSGWYAYTPQRGLHALEWARAKFRGFVVSDVRFPNEAEAIRREGGAIWKTAHGAGLRGSAGEHETEQHVDAIRTDAVVPPGVGLGELPWIVASLLHEGAAR